ncbi:hypothetical protein [Shewanella sp. 10N.286.48.A6]
MLKYTDTALLTFDDEQELYGDESIEQCIARTSESGVRKRSSLNVVQKIA